MERICDDCKKINKINNTVRCSCGGRFYSIDELEEKKERIKEFGWMFQIRDSLERVENLQSLLKDSKK